MIRTHVQKWGHSLGVRIPRKLADNLALHHGSYIDLETKNNSIVITKSSSELDLFLDRITPTNCHDEEFKDDDCVGYEVW